MAGLPLPRQLKVRALHALGFETGFVIIGVTMVAIVLGVSLLQAFMLEIGFMLFFLPYTMAFNWVWDTLRERVIRHRRLAPDGARLIPVRIFDDPPRLYHQNYRNRRTINMVNCTPFFGLTVDKVA